MLSVNKVQLIGNLTKDPEIKATSNGRLARISIATNKRYRDKETSEMKNMPQYHEVVVFNDHLVGLAESYLKKGSHCMIEGALEHRSYEDTDGNKKYVSEVVVRAFEGDIKLGAKSDSAGGDDSGNSGGGSRSGGNDDNRGARGGNQGGNNQSGGNYDDDMDDDIPF